MATPYRGLSSADDVIINSTRFVLESRDLIEDINGGRSIDPPARHLGSLAFDLAEFCDRNAPSIDPTRFLELSNQIYARYQEQRRHERTDEWRTIEQMRDTLSRAVNAKDRLIRLLSSNVMTASVEQSKPSASIRKECRVKVSVENAVVTIDGEPYGLNGTDHGKAIVAEFIQMLISADGEYLPRPKQVKTPTIEKQPEQVRDLIEAQPGVGCRIPRDKIWRS